MSLNRILKMRDGVRAFEHEMPFIISKIIVENEAYIIDMNTEEQLFEQGVNNLGVKISDYQPYAAYTIEVKKVMGQPTNRVTLRDTGDFHSSFYITVNDQQFEIRASDSKTEDLIKKYGRQILGLTKENIAEIIWQYIYPDLCEQRNEYFYGSH